MTHTTKKTLAAVTASFVTLAASVSLAGAQTTPLVCSPSITSIVMNQSATFFASGGDGTQAYTWSIPDATLTNPTGSSFTVRYNTPGTRMVTVTNGGSVASCTIVVNQSASLVATPIVPGIPATGAGGLAGENLGLLLLVIASASIAAIAAQKLAKV